MNLLAQPTATVVGPGLIALEPTVGALGDQSREVTTRGQSARIISPSLNDVRWGTDHPRANRGLAGGTIAGPVSLSKAKAEDPGDSSAAALAARNSADQAALYVQKAAGYSAQTVVIADQAALEAGANAQQQAIAGIARSEAIIAASDTQASEFYAEVANDAAAEVATPPGTAREQAGIAAGAAAAALAYCRDGLTACNTAIAALNVIRGENGSPPMKYKF
jgi:hypothetical protein